MAAAPRLTPTFTVQLHDDVTGYEPIFQTLLSGTFVPEAPMVDVDVQALGYAAGNALVNAVLLYGVVSPPGSTRALRRTGTYSPPANGVQVEKVGGAKSEERLRISRRLRLGGLTPGATYTWAIQFAIVGGAESIPMPTGAEGPIRVCVLPDDSKSYVACLEGNRVVAIRNGGRPLRDEPDQRRTHRTVAAIDVGERPLFLTATRDGTRVLVVNSGSRTVSVIDATRDEVVTESRELGAQPHGIVCPGSTTAYVAADDGNIYPLTLATAEWAEPIAVAAHLSGDLQSTPNGSHLVAISSWAQRAYKVRLRDGSAVTASPNLGAVLSCSAVAPDGTPWVGSLGSPGRVFALDASTLGPTAEFAGPSGDVTGLAITGSGKVLWGATRSGVVAYWTIDSPDDPVNNLYDAPDLGGANGGVALTSDGYIYVCRHDDTELFHFPGAVLHVRPTGGDLGELAVAEFADVTFDGAT